MQLTDAKARRLATGTFVAVCLFYLLDALVPLVARLAWGRGLGLHSQGAYDALLAAMVFIFPLVGYLIARQQPRNGVAWILLAVGVVISLPTSPYIDYGHSVRPGSLPGVTIVAALTAANWAPVIGLIGTFLILLFPDGHLPGPRWRFVAWFSGFAILWAYSVATLLPGRLDQAGIGNVRNPLGLAFLGDVEGVLLPSIAVLPISMVLCAAGLVVRFRRSRGTERLQLKWLATAGAFVAVAYALAMAASLLGNGTWTHDPLWLTVLQNFAVFSFVLIPLAIGIAILKHGLYEIDVVINKAVVFGLLAAFITIVYIAIIVGVGHLAGRGDRPNIALSIAATAAVAVAFQPVRERVERFANRLVYGERATPYEVLSEFADRVGGAYDAADLLPVMARTVAEGVGAARVEIWLAGDEGLVREVSCPVLPDSPADARPTVELNDIHGDRVVPVRHRGELLGAVSVTKPIGESLRPDEASLLDDVAVQAGLVLRNVRLVDELRGSRERLLTSQDDERRRLERTLHNGAQRRLVEVEAIIREAQATLRPEAAEARTALDQLADQLGGAIAELGELARGIHPRVLTQQGLGPALRILAEKAPVPVAVHARVDGQLPRTVEATLYFVAAEALTNVAKYAHASSIQVNLATRERDVVLEVADDGIGGVDDTRGSGIRGLRDRVSAVDGTVVVHSPPGGGTRITCTIPVADARRSAGESLAVAGGS